LSSAEGKNKEYLISELGKAFLKTSAFRIGDFRTSKGMKTPYYVDLNRVSSFPNVFSLVIDCLEMELSEISEKNSVDGLCGIPLNGLLMGAVLAHRQSKPLVHAPLEQERKVVGMISPGSNIIIVDDVSETGKTIESAAMAARANGGVLSQALTLVDRSESAEDDLKKAGIELHAFTTVHELAEKLRDNLALSEEEEDVLENNGI
jgi:orotate phosphoribosyltransferase